MSLDRRWTIAFDKTHLSHLSLFLLTENIREPGILHFSTDLLLEKISDIFFIYIYIYRYGFSLSLCCSFYLFLLFFLSFLSRIFSRIVSLASLEALSYDHQLKKRLIVSRFWTKKQSKCKQIKEENRKAKSACQERLNKRYFKDSARFLDVEISILWKYLPFFF